VRWIHGTCTEAPPQKIPHEDEPFVFSFFTDVTANPDIIAIIHTIQHSVKDTINNLTRYLLRWKRYRSIWKVDKVSTELYAAYLTHTKVLN
jgi:dynein heavy chain